MSATVLVTGAGGPAGVAVIRALAGAGHPVVAADADPLAVGLRLAGNGAVVPRYDAPDYVAALCRLARRAGARALVPTLAEELPILAASGCRLRRAGLANWTPDPAAVGSCLDKWALARALTAAGIATPATSLDDVDGVPGPWVVKPRFGRGSRGVVLVDDPDDARRAVERTPAAVVQTRLVGREFTVDALTTRAGALAGAVPRWRMETRGGISTRGTTFTSDRVVAVVARVLGAIGLAGPANVQGFVDDDGCTAITDVNPRFSGGLPLSLAAGADLVGEYVHAVLGGQVRPERLRYRAGVVMLRHFEEVFEG